MTSTEIVLVRHGETQSNLENLLHGRTDVPLTSFGEWQAQRVADRMVEFDPVDALYSSPLLRARSTARLIAQRIGREAVIIDDLTEFHFGDFEGYTLSNVQESHPELFLQALDTSDFEFRFPNGESRREFHARVKRAVDRLATEHVGKRVVVVAHGGVIASAVTQFTGGNPNDWASFLAHNCSITRLELEGRSPARLACWNDTVHLEVGGLSR